MSVRAFANRVPGSAATISGLLAALMGACAVSQTNNAPFESGGAGGAAGSAGVTGSGSSHSGGSTASGGATSSGGVKASGGSSSQNGGAPAIGSGGGGVDTRSLQCDGTGIGVTIPSKADLEILGDWTIEMWFEDDEAWCHTWRFLFRKGDEFNDPYFIATEDCGVRLGQKSNWNYFTQLENLQSAGYSPGWLHVAATYKHAQQLGQIYINGEPKFPSELPMTATPTALGKPVTMCNPFKGKLEDIRLWNVVRTPEQIKANFAHPLSAFPSELVANWTFEDDPQSTTIRDVTGHGHDGTRSSAAKLASEVHP